MASAKNTSLNLSGKQVKLTGGLTLEQAANFFSEKQNGRKNLDDSFYICDFGRIAKQYENWRELFARIQPFYAVKAGPYEPMIGFLAAVGAGFDCASQAEMDLVLQYKVPPNMIIFSHVAKQTSYIVHARNNGISMMTFDTEEELVKTRKCFPTADLVLRIATDDSESDIKLSRRFGASLEYSKYLLMKAKALGMSVLGISFHVGSGCGNPFVYFLTLQNCRRLFDHARTLGIKMTFLDIGGGFPGANDAKMREIGEVVTKALNEFFPDRLFPDLRIISEPGMYFACSCFTLATNVICKTVSHEGSEVDVEYTLNEGTYGCLPGLVREFRWKKNGEFELFHMDQGKRNHKISKIWGPTCDGDDVVFQKRSISEMEVGEWLFVKNAGAYSFAWASRFNGFGVEKTYNIVAAENADVFERQCAENGLTHEQ